MRTTIGQRLLSTGLVLAGLLIGSNAWACGGFFCNNIEPTVQTGERILFTVDDDSIRAYVQVYYDGPADDFAWVVPVATVPEVGVGTDEVFTRLDELTSPRFQINYEIADSCNELGVYQYGPEEALFDSGGESGDEGGDEGGYVTVLAEGKTGPYNYQIVESNNADILVAWLNENDYEQPPEALPLIEHYVAKEMKFVAVKLQPEKAAGDIAPIILDFIEQSPCIPLVLTSVAAEADMPVKAYVLGEKRSVPTNWLHVTVNQKKLDWFSLENTWWGGGFNNLNSSYETTLIEAIAEADGHAFTTEYAGASSIMEGQLDNGQYDSVSNLLEIDHPADFVMGVQEYFSASNQLLNILRKYIPAPENVGENAFYNNPDEYMDLYDEMEVDLEALYQELIDVIVKPVQEAQEMFDSFPYLTRLYSRVPVEAMDRDPVFDFQDAPDISNVHQATFKMECQDGGFTYYMELENGETFVPEGIPSWWDLNPEENGFAEGDEGSAEEESAAERIELYAPGMEVREVAASDVEYVEEQLKTRSPEDVEVPPVPDTPGTTSLEFEDDSSSSSDGCHVSSTHTRVWLGLTLLLLLAIPLRRLGSKRH